MKKKKVAFTATIVIFTLFVVFFLYSYFIDDRLYPVVEGEIYRSAQPSEDTLVQIINQKRIKTIINLRSGENESPWFLKEKEIAERNNISLYNYHLQAHELPEYRMLSAIVETLIRAERPILIHCRKGADRAGLISAIALSMVRDPPLSVLKEQFSWKYGVFPLYKSAGSLLFSRYEAWLKKNKREHNNENLMFWIKDRYIDTQGNLQFRIDSVNEVSFSRGRSVDISKESAENIKIKGWAFQAETNMPVENLDLIVDHNLRSKTYRKYNRPDVARFFNLGERYHDNFIVGWEAQFERALFSTGCYGMFLRFKKSASDVYRIPTKFTFCITE